MEYTFDNIQIDMGAARNDIEKTRRRMLLYTTLLQTGKPGQSAKENNADPDKKGGIAMFLDKESNWEQKIYGTMKKWESRHPITGIIVCTILGGILISLVAGIVLEAIMMVM